MRAATLAALLLAAQAAHAQTVGPVNPGAQMEVSTPRSITVNGVSVNVRDTTGARQGYLVPDGKGGYVDYAPGPAAKPPVSMNDAEEIRLFARELAAQITGGPTGMGSLGGVVSIPSAFVEQDSRAATPFGRLLGEQMTYELSSRGFAVRDARGKAPAPARSKKGKPAEQLAVLAGSYYVDRDTVFVNARLVEPGGRVLRTGSVLMPMTPVLRRILGLPDPTGLRPTPPTLIGARDVNDPPGSGARQATPYAPAPKKAPPRKTPKKTAQPCPPGCEPVDAAAKAPQTKKPAQAKPAPEAQPQPAPAPAPQ
ncbi:hypothetical protein NNJEOMEG_03705 [Fundidesulfovibrio magnetotacticus]|uniref:FlgO domain-containing protein n=1 Tax=Fundidesulfovibrio magnetotacticus TaxID=2730080 RepID=A0A6V8LVR4_9BACT|nr:hypothetical protein [Fundidesulfovibrio magnetotacticus]GFK95834.1 hypothetical protein NNJEOMEG_03705 [Fundidesulfovibrio magnetotacticus]